jgi:hypothetical protein
MGSITGGDHRSLRPRRGDVPRPGERFAQDCLHRHSVSSLALEPGKRSVIPKILTELPIVLTAARRSTQRSSSAHFCSASIDRAAAEQFAAATSKISQACSDASYIKIMLSVLIPFGVLIFFPFLGLAGLVGFVFLKYAVPVMTIRWWVKYGRLKTTDSDFSKARGTVIPVSAISFLILLFLRVNFFTLRL